MGERLRSLFLANDGSRDRSNAQATKGKLITMPPVGYRLRKTRSGAAEQSCEEAMLRSL
ncbi:MAG TPA: hypothetical protein VNV88_01790 [Candidatus Solibacter sp.]|nr:hypothetical protein [Candidatus Solibacter sp.]